MSVEEDMEELPLVYAKGIRGIRFEGQLVNYNNPQMDTPQDMREATAVYVIFVKPDGTRLRLPAGITDNDEDLSNGADITYINREGDSILDQAGPWRFTVAAEFGDAAYLESPQWARFYVVGN